MAGADVRNGVPPLEERTAEIKDVRLRYYVGGAGPPLILVHGLGGAASNWSGVVARLHDRFRLLVPDLPGHAGSTAFPAVTSLDPYADRLARPAVAGHSMGGLIGLRLAVNFPGHVTSLVLTAAAGIRSSTREAERYLAVVGFLRPTRRYSRHRNAIARSALLRMLVFGYFGASDPLALSDEAVDDFLQAPRLHTDTGSARRALVRDDPRVDLERVTCPVYVLWGARDNQVTVDDAFEYARRLRAPLRLVADAGHLLIGERPDACAEAIESFLLRPDSGTRRTPSRGRSVRPASRRGP